MKTIIAACIVAQLVAWGLAYSLGADGAHKAADTINARNAALASAMGE